MRWGLPVGRLFGIPVKIHWTCFILLAWYLKISLPNGFNVTDLWLIAIVVGTVLLHELGHCLAARSNGGEAYEILLWPLGGLAFTAGDKNTPRDWAWVAMAGPLMHLPLSLICILLLANHQHAITLADFNPLGEWNVPGTSQTANLLYLAFKLQVLLFCLNMLPAYPLDGGQIFLAVLSGRMPLARAAILTAGVTVLSAVGLLALGVDIVPLWLVLEAWTLYHAAQHGLLGMGSPRTRAYRRLDSGSEPPRPATAPEYLRPCPHCARSIHIRAERCPDCDRLVD